MTNFLTVVGILGAAVAVLWVIYRRGGEGALLLEPALQWWDRLHDWLTRQPEPPAQPAAAVVINPDPRPLPRPPPRSRRNDNGAGPAADEPGQGFGPAQSDLLHAIGALVARASGGDIRDVRRTIKTLATAADALGDGVSHLGTRLGEPDRHYGPEIWEPLAQAGAQLRSGALHMGQSDAMVTSLLASTVGELAESPRMAPHASQLNGPV